MEIDKRTLAGWVPRFLVTYPTPSEFEPRKLWMDGNVALDSLPRPRPIFYQLLSLKKVKFTFFWQGKSFRPMLSIFEPQSLASGYVRLIGSFRLASSG